MKQYDLSILIPARNEMFISNTVKDILKNKRGNTEVIVGLDGLWAEPGIEDHPDVRIVYVSESIGQRAMTNKLCKLSTAKYVAKCDAHCAFDEGFDEKLLKAIEGHDDWTVTPALKNLWAFDWKCPKCGSRWFQGPTPTQCMVHTDPAKNSSPLKPNPVCDNTEGFTRRMVWQPNPKRPTSRSFRFDKTMHFQYWREFNKRPEGQGEVTPSLSLQGSFFMMTRKKYIELDICDEKHGSWGQQGTEVACKTWLSGGQVMCVQGTWYAHMFRTQGLDFGFPYPNSGMAQEVARQYSRHLWLDNTWDKAIYPLEWLLAKFAPVPDWHTEATKGIIYYTDSRLDSGIAEPVRKQLKTAGLPIVSASLKPLDFGKNIHLDLERGTLTYFKQIVAALEASTADIVFFCEHDVLYHQSHFDFTPIDKDMFYYNQNFWRVRNDGFAVHWNANQVSGLCCYREHALAYYKARLAVVEAGEFDRSYEPGGRDKTKYKVWKSAFPNIDIRHDGTLTKSKWSLADFRDKSTAQGWQESTIEKIPGWDNLERII
jgi:hypothetical protein